MTPLPTGTVTLLFADIEGSTRLLHRLGDRYPALLETFRETVGRAVERHGGTVVDARGEELFAAFPGARSALAAAAAIQEATARPLRPETPPLHVRIGLHTGEPVVAGTHYVGIDVHRAARICAAGHGGQVLLSAATRHLVVDDLPAGVTLRDLGLHRLKDLSEPVHLYQAVLAGLRADFPPLRSLGPVPHNLPVPPTSFVGRERELAEVRDLLERAGLVTLTGFGGSGKTRLALQVAAGLLDSYPDGVWLVDLSTVSDPDLIPHTVGAAVGRREEGGPTTLAVLLDYLASKRLLLVLDNCEHLVGECARVVEAILRRAPGIRVLATSREVLRVPGEVVYAVPPLSLPAGPDGDPATVLASEAARLFLERAGLVRPPRSLHPQEARAVAAIARRLDGIPLAIELAAARARVLALEQIVQRLDDRFRLLSRPARGAVPRQQTLRATMDWSYDLLLPEEQALLTRLAVFAGTFDLEAIEAVCADPRPGSGQGAGVLDLLTSLVDKSLVMVEPSTDVARYRLLDTVRAYCRERLTAPDLAALQDRHLRYCTGVAEVAEPHLRGPEQQRWLARLDREHDNLRAALAWSVGRPEAVGWGLRLAAALWWFWYRRGHYSEGRRWLRAVLTAAAAEPAALRLKALYAAAYLAWRQGDMGEAETYSLASVGLAQEHGEPLPLAYALLVRGIVVRAQRRPALARELHERGLALFRQVGHLEGIAWSLRMLGIVEWHDGRMEQARARFEEACALLEQIEDGWAVMVCLSDLGRVAAHRGDDEAAESLLRRALDRYTSLEDEMGMASAWELLGEVAARQGRFDEADALLARSLHLYEKLGDRWDIAAVHAAIAEAAERRGEHARARTEWIDALRRWRDLADRQGVARCLEGLARLARVSGQEERAAALAHAADTVRGSPRLPATADTPLSGMLPAAPEALRAVIDEIVAAVLSDPVPGQNDLPTVRKKPDQR
ncbi:MAG: tetratricopeptide repeat protein [Armatimonadota bacterium]|nr:tetratricopeptide repeat protein [Armatimonadota bacterium]MDR7448738.1 tetratricopeptide repeat protein [Armatimonadota bacterium]MDR7460467.1 tetratricopeptide repeat protein [Armatimonadota bacterium]MDR7479076.1 tetratricopeptide repeat protein [Armatimonadota bacterium]MDR7488648.1 tetratricopeptide repeat protein [Armatimonadota bacterium]